MFWSTTPGGNAGGPACFFRLEASDHAGLPAPMLAASLGSSRMSGPEECIMILFITRLGLSVIAFATFATSWALLNTPAGVAGLVMVFSALSVLLVAAAMTETHQERLDTLLEGITPQSGVARVDLHFAGLPALTLPVTEFRTFVAYARTHTYLTLLNPSMTAIPVCSADGRVRLSVLAFSEVLVLNFRLEGTSVRFRILMSLSSVDRLLNALT